MKLKIVADANMPLVEELFSKLGDICTENGRSLNKSKLEKANVLLVRSVTKINKELLEGTPVKFVGTATIGTDHVDLDYLKQAGIAFASAPGCNANSVAEYILSALAVSGRLQKLLDGEAKLAIVGVGNVGTRLAYFAKLLGFKFVCYDPPLAEKQNNKAIDYCDWKDVLDSDVISLHVPLTKTADYPTLSMFGRSEIEQLKPGCLLINSSRGAVVNNQALFDFLQTQKQRLPLEAILDVWENEPGIDLKLRDKCLLGTMHIAGYSVDGKQAGSQMILESLVNHFELESENNTPIEGDSKMICWDASKSFYQNLKDCILAAYDIRDDSKKLSQLNSNNISKSFDLLRQNYPDRLEFKHYLIENIQSQYSSLMNSLGFQIETTETEEK